MLLWWQSVRSSKESVPKESEPCTCGMQIHYAIRLPMAAFYSLGMNAHVLFMRLPMHVCSLLQKFQKLQKRREQITRKSTEKRIKSIQKEVLEKGEMDLVLVGWLVVFNVPSTARSFRDGSPIYCPLRRTISSINTPFQLGIEPWAVAWQSIRIQSRI